MTPPVPLWAARAARLRALFVPPRPAPADRPDSPGVVRPTLPDAHPAGDRSADDTVAGWAEDHARVTAALAALPADQRRAVELRYLHGLPVADIAAALDRSRPAAAGLIHRGLTALQAAAA